VEDSGEWVKEIIQLRLFEERSSQCEQNTGRQHLSSYLCFCLSFEYRSLGQIHILDAGYSMPGDGGRWNLS
jgi:hypothetical protein